MCACSNTVPRPGACRSSLADAADPACLDSWDLLYLGPPYNSRSYRGYYHLPESIACGYQGPVHGKSGVPSQLRLRSRFTCKRTAAHELTALIARTHWRTLLLHYSDDGLVTPAEIRRALAGR